jgi:hypothetical protein
MGAPHIIQPPLSRAFLYDAVVDWLLRCGAGRARAKDAMGRPRYGRDYAQQLKVDLAREMDRRRAENDARMRKLREQFREQNRNIEEASSGVKEKLENARSANAAQIEEMQEQRKVEVEEITKNTERIREQVDGVGQGLKEQLKAEYDAVANQAQELVRRGGKTESHPAQSALHHILLLTQSACLIAWVQSDKSKEGYVEPPRPPELDGDDEGLPYSLDLFLSAAPDMYDVVALSIEEETLYEEDGWEAYRASVLSKREGEGQQDGGSGGVSGAGSVTIDDAGSTGGGSHSVIDDEVSAAQWGGRSVRAGRGRGRGRGWGVRRGVGGGGGCSSKSSCLPCACACAGQVAKAMASLGLDGSRPPPPPPPPPAAARRPSRPPPPPPPPPAPQRAPEARASAQSYDVVELLDDADGDDDDDDDFL